MEKPPAFGTQLRHRGNARLADRMPAGAELEEHSEEEAELQPGAEAYKAFLGALQAGHSKRLARKKGQPPPPLPAHTVKSEPRSSVKDFQEAETASKVLPVP